MTEQNKDEGAERGTADSTKLKLNPVALVHELTTSSE
jgi:hypothetical protein